MLRANCSRIADGLSYLGDGDDQVNVLHNKCNVYIDGGIGNDTFVVRSFIMAESGFASVG